MAGSFNNNGDPYQVLTSADLVVLEMRVSNAIAAGFEPCGGVSMLREPTGQRQYAQAVWFHHEDEDDPNIWQIRQTSELC